MNYTPASAPVKKHVAADATTATASAYPEAQSLQSFGISLSIVIGGFFFLPLLLIAIIKPENVATRILSLSLRRPRIVLLSALGISVFFEIVIAVIPLPEIKNAFAMVSRMLNVAMWMIASLLFVIWLLVESYDSFAVDSGWFSSGDLSTLVSPVGRDKILDDFHQKTNKLAHLYPYISKNKFKLHPSATRRHPRLDIRPTKWLQHVASKEAREMWAPIIEAFFPFATAIKQNALNGTN